MNLNEVESELDISNDINKQNLAKAHYLTQGGFNPS